jgi:tripartite-type tricarboxylate transporter receptor subunit TctC
VEARPADQPHRALGAGRRDRPGYPPRRIRNGSCARPEDRGREPAGASGSIGTKNALDAPKDGYTWTAGAVQDLGVYKVLGMAPTDLGDWNLYLSVANVPVISVNPQTPYQNLGDLLKAMKDKPKTVTISTGGVASASHNAAEAVTRAAGSSTGT